MLTIHDYSKAGYAIYSSSCLGELKGLSPTNCLYSDIKTIIVSEGQVFISESNQVLILSRKAEYIYNKNLSEENSKIDKFNRLTSRLRKKHNIILK